MTRFNEAEAGQRVVMGEQGVDVPQIAVITTQRSVRRNLKSGPMDAEILGPGVARSLPTFLASTW